MKGAIPRPGRRVSYIEHTSAKVPDGEINLVDVRKSKTRVASRVRSGDDKVETQAGATTQCFVSHSKKYKLDFSCSEKPLGGVLSWGVMFPLICLFMRWIFSM